MRLAPSASSRRCRCGRPRAAAPTGSSCPGRPDRYRELSDEVMAIFAEYTPLVEPISLDEAFLDVTASAAAFGDGETIGRQIKRRVLDEVGLVVSVGVATNKLCAKVASDLRKPDALVVVPVGRRGRLPRPAADPPALGRRAAGPGGPRRVRRRDDRAAGGDTAGNPPPSLRTVRRRPVGARPRDRPWPRRGDALAEERRPRAHVRHRLGGRRSPRGDVARPRRVGRAPAAAPRPGGRIGPAQAALRGVRDAHPAGAAAAPDPRGEGRSTTPRWPSC